MMPIPPLPRTLIASLMMALCGVPLWTPAPAKAQVAPPVVSACSGVSLPRSVVTDILRPVIVGIAGPVQTTVNSVLGVVRVIPLVGQVFPPLNLNATGLLDDAEEGDDITLNVLDSDGEIVGPADECNTQADSFTLATPAGLSIGGNLITGLGATGATASAGELNSIAFGNSATTAAGATGAVAIGRQASVTGAAAGSIALGAGSSASVANSLALGAGSTAGRGASANYTALGLTGAQTSSGEVSFGAAGATRQLTHVAAGSASTDAVNVGQLQGVSDQLTSLVGGAETSITNLTTSITNGAIGPVRYSSALTPTVPNAGTVSNDLTFVGLGGPVTLHNIASGAIGLGSTDGVNGGQMFSLASRLAAGFGGGSVYDPATNLLTVGLTYQGATYTSLQDVLNSLGTPGGGASPFLSVLSSGVAASATGADSVAIGPGSVAGAANSVALGAGSLSSRGALTGYAALGLAVPQASVGEVSFGSVGAARQLTNIAAGSAATDAVNVDQLQGVSDQLTGLVGGATTSIANLTTNISNGAIGPVRYSGALTPTVPNAGAISNDLTLVGLGGPVGLHNIASGSLGLGSTDAVNGGQVFSLASRLAAGFGGSSAYDATTNLLTVGLTYQGATYANLQDVLNALGTPGGGASPFLAVFSSGLAASASGADSVAVGPGAVASAANSAAIGAGSVSSRGALTGYAALGLATPQTSIGEISFGAPGAERQLTNIAAGTAATDAVNVGQLQGVAGQLTALADTSVRYTDVLAGRVVLAGTDGTVIANLTGGALTATSMEAVNGGQIFDLASRLATGFGGSSAYDPATNRLTVGLTYQGATYASLQDVLNTVAAAPGGAASPFLSVFSTGVAASATGAESLAAGPGAIAGAANSVALGAGSIASRGGLTGYAALGVTTPQTSVGEVSLGSVGAERQLTNVAAGTALTDAVNVGQLHGVSTRLSDLADTSVRYTDVLAGRVVLAGTSGTTISNLAAGAVTLNSTEAVNGGQLFDTNTRLTGAITMVANNTTEIEDLRTTLNLLTTPVVGGASPFVRITATGGAALANGDDMVAIGQDAVVTAHNSVALGNQSTAARGAQVGYNALGVAGPQTSAGEVSIGAAGAERQLTHVAAGTAATDAVNVAQLQGVSDRIDTLSQTAVGYDDASRSTLTLGGVGGTTVTNVAAGQVTAASTDAVNGSQLYATNQTVAVNTTAITNLTNNIANGAMGPVQYSNAATPTVANGGVRTDNLTLVGASGGPIVLSNVGNGRIAAGSTDAVNGGQIYQLATAALNAVSYDVDAAGNRTGTITLAGTTPVVMGNVGAAAVTATSTQAVNGSQLFATNQTIATVRTTADAAMALGMNSVQYSDADRTVIRLSSAAGGPVRMSNLADGVEATDAVTVQQLNDGMRRAVSDAATYTDMRIAMAHFQMGRVRNEMNAGTAGALAAAGLPQIAEPGRGMMAVGFGSYEGQTAVAFGFSRATPSGGAVIRAGATYDSVGRVGVNGGVGWRF